jgi:hypothetical protein
MPDSTTERRPWIPRKPALTLISSVRNTVVGTVTEKEVPLKRIIAVVVLVLAVAAVAAGIAIGAGRGDDERPIMGSALERASDAALAHTGGGLVTDTEAGDEEGAYEVEVTLDDGSQVDVHLDARFNVLGGEADSDEAEDEASNDD